MPKHTKQNKERTGKKKKKEKKKRKEKKKKERNQQAEWKTKWDLTLHLNTQMGLVIEYTL